MDELKQALTHRLIAISSIIPFTKCLQAAIYKDFNLLTSRDGYELLRYLLLACGKSFDLNSSAYMSIGDVPWKDQLSDHKATVEKWKSDILLAAKNLTRENSVAVKPLRKSDLVAPCNMRYFNCCVSLSQLAINHQLQHFGIKIDTKLPLSCFGELQELYYSFIEQEMELENESKVLQAQTEQCLKETEELIKEINYFKKMKNEIEIITEEAIKRCPLQYKDALKDPSTQLDAITRWSKHINDMCVNNNNRELMLNKLDKDLKKLYGFTKSEFEKTSIDGNDMVPHISSELLLFAHENKIDIIDGDTLSLLGLLKTFVLTIPHDTIDIKSFEKFLEFVYTPNESELLEKLQNIEQEVRSEINHLRPVLVNQEYDENFFKKVFVTVPKIQFTNDLQHQPLTSSLNSPFIDIEKLDALLKSSKKS